MKRKWIWAACFILVLLAYVAGRASAPQGRVRIFFFYSEERGEQKLQKEFIEHLSQKFPVEIQSFSLDKLENYDLLGKFEKQLKQEDNELPAVIIGNKILGGESKIRKELEGLVKSYAEKGGVD